MEFHQEKWKYQAKQRVARGRVNTAKRSKTDSGLTSVGANPPKRGQTSFLGGFLQRAQEKMLETPWQIIQVN